MTDLDAFDLLIRRARVVPLDGGPLDGAGADAADLDRSGLDGGTTDGPLDLRIAGGVLVEIGHALDGHGEEELDADGRWAVPGLWDAHVHLQQWSRSLVRLDLSGTTGPEDVTVRVGAHLDGLPDDGTLVVGYGHRSAAWSRRPTVAALDAVTGRRPVVLISGDAHHGWLNTTALALLGVPHQDGPLEEGPWFAVFPHVEALEQPGEQALRRAVRGAAARGVVGVADMEWEDGPHRWPERVAAGVDLLRVRTATYESGLGAVLAEGLRTGDALPGGRGLVTMGPLKVIFDGSLNTRTAYCCTPYPGPGGAAWRGVLNLTPHELTALVARAHDAGLESAVHAIGDAAGTAALDAFAAVDARGSVEHVQLVARADLPRFGALGIRASVQPAHLLDDRDVTTALWPGAGDRCFALRSLLDAGATLALGSDAPVARLDPWLAMTAAVHRTADWREPWTPEESLTPAQALGASTDGRRLDVGEPGDVVLLDDDPLAPEDDSAAAARRLQAVGVAVTVVAGRVTHRDL